MSPLKRALLMLDYTSIYGPEANRIEWLRRALRRAVTHTHTRQFLPLLLEHADTCAHTTFLTDTLRQIGRPFADVIPLTSRNLLMPSDKSGSISGQKARSKRGDAHTACTPIGEGHPDPVAIAPVAAAVGGAEGRPEGAESRLPVRRGRPRSTTPAEFVAVLTGSDSHDAS
jgi:hypothetical protein